MSDAGQYSTTDGWRYKSKEMLTISPFSDKPSIVPVANRRIVALFAILQIAQSFSWQSYHSRKLLNRNLRFGYRNQSRLSRWTRRILHPTIQIERDDSVANQTISNHGIVFKSINEGTTTLFDSCIRLINFAVATLLLCFCSIHADISAAFLMPTQGADVTSVNSLSDASRSLSNINTDRHRIKKHNVGTAHNGPDIQNHQWIFENGKVTLPEEIIVNGLKFANPRLLGSGAGGAVFVLHHERKWSANEPLLKSIMQPEDVVLKVSWKASTASVSNECNVLRNLQKVTTLKYGSYISTIEMCLGEIPYKPDPTRTMIILKPFFADEQATSLQEFLTEPEKMDISITLIIRTMLQMLSANTVTIDVQPLISRETGNLLFVDFTEAITINEDETTTNADKIAVQNFINEMMLLIPTLQQESVASEILIKEIVHYPIDSMIIYQALLEQNFSQNTLNFIEKRLTQHYSKLIDTAGAHP